MSKKATKTSSKEVVSSYEQRDVVLGKIRGYPPWPGMIVDPDSVPHKVQEERPSKKANFYCVQFFPAGDFAWLVPKDISKLKTHEIESYIHEPFKKSGDLLEGYRIALDPKKWEEKRSNDVLTQEEDNAEVDELESEGGGAASTKKQSKTKKRKRESEPAPAKTRKPAKPKKEPSEASKKKTTTKGKGSRSKAVVESEDEGEAEAEAEDEDVGPSKKASPPPAKKAKRDKPEEEGDDAKLSEDPEAVKVREWRHRLQKAFLGKNIPEEVDMPTLDALFTTVESYDKISVQYLQFSKIGKVMRHITLLPDDKVPRDDEFKFRDRAKALVDQWHQVLNANKPNGSESGAAGTTNGAPAPKMEKNGATDEAGVTEAAAAINLNGKGSDAPVVEEALITSDADADAVGDTSLLGDVTMSEA